MNIATHNVIIVEKYILRSTGFLNSNCISFFFSPFTHPLGNEGLVGKCCHEDFWWDQVLVSAIVDRTMA